MKKIAYFLIAVIVIFLGIYYFIPKTIEVCGFLPSGKSCSVWKCDRGFAIKGVARPTCLLGGNPVLQSSMPQF